MIRVAVAGGSGGLGRTVVEAIVSSKMYEVFVLSRKVGSHGSSKSVSI
jgi:uncharacterized protein YbjT (DUF2867 family)